MQINIRNANVNHFHAVVVIDERNEFDIVRINEHISRFEAILVTDGEMRSASIVWLSSMNEVMTFAHSVTDGGNWKTVKAEIERKEKAEDAREAAFWSEHFAEQEAKPAETQHVFEPIDPNVEDGKEYCVRCGMTHYPDADDSEGEYATCEEYAGWLMDLEVKKHQGTAERLRINQISARLEHYEDRDEDPFML